MNGNTADSTDNISSSVSKSQIAFDFGTELIKNQYSDLRIKLHRNRSFTKKFSSSGTIKFYVTEVAKLCL